MWRLTYKWARHSHPKKSRHWVTARYFGVFNKSRPRCRWVFGDRDSGFYVHKFAWTPIIRHQMVKGASSPDDPALTDYWAQRRRRRQPPLGTATLRLIQAQHGRCPICADYLSRRAQQSGSCGSRRPARRSANLRSPPNRVKARRMSPSQSA